MNTARALLSTTALAAFSILAAGSSPELAEELAELSEQPVTAPIDADSFTLDDLRGRKIWVIDADPSYCTKLEQLGLEVECDPNWGSGNTEQIVIRCTEIPHAAAPMILDYLDLNHFTVDTYVTDPSSANDSECGDVYEIAIWFGPSY